MASRVELHEEASAFIEPSVGTVGSQVSLAPLLEGARARGVADAFEMIGRGAILLDGQGAILHVGGAALPLLGGVLNVAAGHLMGRTTEDNQSIQALIEGLLGDARSANSIVLPGDQGSSGLRIRGFAFPGGEKTPFQLLAAVLLLESPETTA